MVVFIAGVLVRDSVLKVGVLVSTGALAKISVAVKVDALVKVGVG